MSKFTPEFIEETAREFGLDHAELTNVLITAEEEYDCQQFSQDGREFHNECSENFKNIQTNLSKAAKEIQGCEGHELEELEFFRMAGYQHDAGGSDWKVTDQLSYLSGLFTKFNAFYKDGPGRPKELTTLEEFGSQLSEFWQEQTGERFGQDFHPEFEDDKADAEVGILQPKSQAAKFFCACTMQLDQRYEPAQCRTVMINLAKGSPKGFSKLAQKNTN